MMQCQHLLDIFAEPQERMSSTLASLDSGFMEVAMEVTTESCAIRYNCKMLSAFKGFCCKPIIEQLLFCCKLEHSS